jgi:5'-nucleotidase
MRILVTNDDGILAPGLLALRRTMAELGDVTVVAPITPQSAVAHSITLTDPIRVHRVNLGDGLLGHGVAGRPARGISGAWTARP